MTLEMWIELTDVLVSATVSWVWLATLYVALGKVPGLQMLRGLLEQRESFAQYVRERVDLVLVGSLFPLSAILLYYLLLSFNVQALEANGTVRMFGFRIPFIAWLCLVGIHLFNGRINAALRFLIHKWKLLHTR